MKHFFYLIGVPGAGKTTLFRSLFSPLPSHVTNKPFAHTVYPGGIQLGAERETFGGTDVLPLHVQPIVIDWLQRTKATAVVAEGDRLSNDKFFRAVEEAGWNLTVALLYCDDYTADERRAQRGSNQDPSWLSGRSTKVNRLTESWVNPDWVLYAAEPVQTLVDRLRSHPAIQTILSETEGVRVA